MFRYIFFFIFLGMSSQAFSQQTCNNTIQATAPDKRFTIIGSEIIDKETGLIWQKCSWGQTDHDIYGCLGNPITYTWQQALQAIEDIRQQTGVIWRLPNINELDSLVEVKCYAPSANISIFSNSFFYNYWSASPFPFSNASHAWYVNFHDGNSFISDSSNGMNIRLVRDGQLSTNGGILTQIFYLLL